MAGGQHVVNRTVSSADGNHAASEVYNSCTSTSVGNSPETMGAEKFVVRPNVCVAPGPYATPQTVGLVNLKEHTPPSQIEDTEAERNNTIK